MFTAFVLVLGFMGYWWMQDSPKGKVASKDKGGAAQPLVNRETKDPYGPGKNVWVKKYDDETGLLASRFKADDYQPRNDGWMVVKQPRAQFFMDDGRAISVEGESGEIIMDDPANKQGAKALAGSRDTPSRGRLHKVIVKLWYDIRVPEEQLDDEYIRKHDPRPALTITLPNAAFDNQTFKIHSEGTKQVKADQVPVTLRGEDYDFDGRGLTIRWNERDRRLQLLEIAHGERLVIKHPSNVMKRQETVADAMFEGSGMPLPVMLAARNREAAAEAIKAVTPEASSPRRPGRGPIPKPKIKPNLDPPLYRATFHDNVKVVQGDELSVVGNRMSVDFLMNDEEGEEGAATRPSTTQPTTRTARKGGRRPATTQAVAGTNPSTTTRSVDEAPVIITWTGKLTVEPLAVGTETPLKSGDAVVRIEGTPVTATQEGSTILCGALTYRTEDQAMLLAPQGNQPVVMKDSRGALVHTTRMDFFQPKRQAILYGASDALFPQEDASGKPVAPMLAKWNKTCTLYFAAGEAGGGNMNIERAELDGSVNIVHPQIKLNSNQLELGFDTTRKAATQPALTPEDQKRVALRERLNAFNADIAKLEKENAELSAKLPGDFAKWHQEREAQIDKLEERRESLQKQISSVQAGTEPAKAVLEEASNLTTVLSELRDEMSDFAKAKEALAARQKDVAGQIEARDAVARQVREMTAKAATRPATRPSIRTDLKTLVATGAVYCEMADAGKKSQTIDCNRLTLQTATDAQGRIYPSTVNADGQVHAVDAEQDLRAGHLAVALRPSTRPSKEGTNAGSAELQSMVAHNNVKVVSKDGTVALADQLLIDNKDGRNNVKLLGQPFATIIDKKNTLTGPIIEISPEEQRFEVVGGGNMKGMQQEKAGEAERPMDVTWNRGLTYNGKSNVVDVTGQVVAVTIDSDGSTNTAKGDHVRMTLADAPTTRPSTTQASATTKPATQPSRSQYAGMSAKTVKQVQFDQNAEIMSVSLADDGSLLRRVHLLAQVIQYDMVQKRMTVPVEGKMIAEDHRPTTQPAANGATAEARPAGAGLPGAGGGTSRGSTAFQWSRKFTYDDATRVAVMEGDLQNPVVVVHQEDKPNAKPYRLTADTVSAELEEVEIKTDAKPAGTQPATKPARQTKVQLKKVTADGHLVFNGPGAEIRAVHMEYDPTTQWLIARGTEREPVDFNIATQPGGRKTAEEVQYNLESGMVKGVKISGRKG